MYHYLLVCALDLQLLVVVEGGGYGVDARHHLHADAAHTVSDFQYSKKQTAGCSVCMVW